ITLLLTGVALLTVVEFLAHDLDRWARASHQPHWTIPTVRSLLSAVGVLVALVAVISRTVSVFWHDVVAPLLVVVFGLAALLVPGALLWITAAAFALLVTVIVLYLGVDYLNMTAFEMGAAAIVYIWLLLFIRTVSAAAEGTPMPADAVTAAGDAGSEPGDCPDRDAAPGTGREDMGR